MLLSLKPGVVAAVVVFLVGMSAGWCRAFQNVRLSNNHRVLVSSFFGGGKHWRQCFLNARASSSITRSLFSGSPPSFVATSQTRRRLSYGTTTNIPSISTRYSSSIGNGGNGNDNNDDFRVPNKITIPEDRIEMSFVRSSGAGGQNVNKVNTKVELRFHVMDATWLPREVRERLLKNESHRINKEGWLTITSQEYRTQSQNRKDAINKLEEIVLKSYPRPKIRQMRKGLSKKTKEQRREQKKFLSEKKKLRKPIQF